MTNTTDLAPTIEQIVSTQITETLHQEAVMLGAVRDLTEQVGPGMDRIDVPLYVNPSIGPVSESTGVADNAIAVGVAQMLLDQHKGAGTSISRRASVQAKIDAVREWIKNATFEMASEVDDYILSLINAGASAREAMSGDALADLAKAKKILDALNVPKSERFVIASAGFMEQLLTTNNIIRANEYSSSAPIQAGFVSNIYGFSVLESTSASIVEDGFHAVHKSGTLFARQINPELMKEEKALLVRDEYSLTHLYGSQLADASRLVVFDADGVA